jgi:hypothetical protein
MSVLLYVATVAAILYCTNRWITPLSRGAALLLLLIPCVFTFRALVTGGVYGPVDLPYSTVPLSWMRDQYAIGEPHNAVLSDLYCQMIPWRKAVQWSLAHGEWPLWNRFNLSGDILAAAAQPAVYSPFTLLACLLSVAQGLTYSATIAFFLACLGAYLLARELGCRDLAAFFGAAGWTYSTAVAFFILWPLGLSWGLLPLVLLATRRVAREPNRRTFALLVVAFVIVILAGHPETLLHVVAVGIVYGVFELARRRALLRPALTAIGAGVVALLLCAIYLLPILEAAPQTMEHDFRENVFANQPRGVHINETLARMATDVFAVLHGRFWKAANVGYVPTEGSAAGSLILAAAIYALIRRRSPETWFFAGLALFGFLAHSDWTPLARLLQHIPLFDIALNHRLAFAAAFSICMLAAFGIEELCRRERDRTIAIVFAVTLAVLSIGSYYLLRADFYTDDLVPWGEHRLAGELGVLAIATLLVSLKLRARLVVPALIGLLLVQRTLTNGDVYRSFPARAAYPPIPILEPLKNEPRPFRIVGHGNAMIPGTNALYELEDVRGYQAMTFAPYAETYRIWCIHQPVWFNRVDDLREPFLDFLNVKYAITWDREPATEGWREVARQEGSVLLENEQVIPRAFVPRWIHIKRARWEALNEMSAATNFADYGWIVSREVAPHERQNGPGKVTTIRDSRLGYELDVDMEGDGWVFTSINAWKGWRAYIDGRRVETTMGNAAFVSLFVPRGKHHVRLIYWPESFVIGRAISAFTLIALVSVFVVLRRRDRSGARAS